MDDIHMSLDDIIKKKKIGQQTSKSAKLSSKKQVLISKTSGQIGKKNLPMHIFDARDIICSKTRGKIFDARDKLNQIMRKSDARERLRKRSQHVSSLTFGKDCVGRKRLASESQNRYDLQVKLDPLIPYVPSRPHTSYKDLDNSEELEMIEPVRAKRLHIPTKRQPPLHHINLQTLKRTVQNEVFSLPTSMPPLPRFRSVRSIPETSIAVSSSTTVELPWSDPFQLYDMRSSRPNLPTPPLTIANVLPHEKTALKGHKPRSILRKRSRSPSSSDQVLDHPQLSPRMRARLERAPNPSDSMGIFAKRAPDDDYYKSQHIKSMSLQTSSSLMPTYHNHSTLPSPPSMGYRIVVSNLHSKVVHQDIQELFGDIGDLIEARLVRPGVAEVIYRTLKDAEKAVDAYHNRQLDGQPMNCLLVHPRASNKPTAPAINYTK